MAFSHPHLYEYQVVHEVGHLFGMSHHTSKGMMNLLASSPWTYSGLEIENMLMMLRLPTGTTWPLNDRNTSGTLARSVRGYRVTIECSVSSDTIRVYARDLQGNLQLVSETK